MRHHVQRKNQARVFNTRACSDPSEDAEISQLSNDEQGENWRV